MKIKEPVNTWTHLVGFMAGIVGLIFLLSRSSGDLSKLVVMSIFGFSVLLLYGASSLYHGVKTTKAKELLLRKLDHIAIFLLIAGTYTPILYYGLDGGWKLSMLIVVWAVTVLGSLMKAFFINMPRWLSTAVYLALGWSAIIPFARLIDSLPGGALVLIVAGGVAYTIGGVVYGTKKNLPVCHQDRLSWGVSPLYPVGDHIAFFDGLFLYCTPLGRADNFRDRFKAMGHAHSLLLKLQR